RPQRAQPWRGRPWQRRAGPWPRSARPRPRRVRPGRPPARGHVPKEREHPMTTPVSGVSVEAQNFNWLVARFANETAGVIAAIAVSSDGLLVATSSAIERANADRLAAISSALLSLSHGVSDCHPLGEPDKVVIELAQGYLLVC